MIPVGLYTSAKDLQNLRICGGQVSWIDLIKKARVDSLFLAYLERVRVEIELRQMRYFLAIAEERSFSRAAKRCHVAQSSLSRQIHDVMAGLQAQLFDRLPARHSIDRCGQDL